MNFSTTLQCSWVGAVLELRVSLTVHELDACSPGWWCQTCKDRAGWKVSGFLMHNSQKGLALVVSQFLEGRPHTCFILLIQTLLFSLSCHTVSVRGLERLEAQDCLWRALPIPRDHKPVGRGFFYFLYFFPWNTGCHMN